MAVMASGKPLCGRKERGRPYRRRKERGRFLPAGRLCGDRNTRRSGGGGAAAAAGRGV